MFELNAKLTGKAFSEAAKAKGDKGSEKSSAGKADFGSLMDQVQGKEVSEVVKILNNEIDLRPQKEIRAIASESMENVAMKSGEASPSSAMQKVADIMGEVNDGQVKLQRLVDLITSGQKLSPQELIAVEAGVFSLTQELEILGKATQEATQGVRQTLNTNLG